MQDIREDVDTVIERNGDQACYHKVCLNPLEVAEDSLEDSLKTGDGMARDTEQKNSPKENSRYCLLALRVWTL